MFFIFLSDFNKFAEFTFYMINLIRMIWEKELALKRNEVIQNKILL